MNFPLIHLHSLVEPVPNKLNPALQVYEHVLSVDPEHPVSVRIPYVGAGLHV
jgi:hypothetical protein